MNDAAGHGNPPVQDGDLIRVQSSGSGWVNGVEGVVAGEWEGQLRIKLPQDTLPGVEAVLLEKDALYTRIETGGVSTSGCGSCGGSGKVEWTDDDGWQHEAPCGTCAKLERLVREAGRR
ncbi:hypothetical protein [Streptomyces clavuligerus]|uniref:hypothetical protein n=1 Tax=Streptomyces clavuligerus TaxID=1901 RepID=UPI0001851D47|nr:hypothetical protein [Streptomyces clavuligerus]WDN56965.1 hypothetical protein LL058_34775 [Streptomyces clavuligerus]